MIYLGIDFGTIWTKAAIYDSSEKKTELVKMEDVSDGSLEDLLIKGKYTIPTAVYYSEEKATFFVGKQAVRKRDENPEMFFDKFKPELSTGKEYKKGGRFSYCDLVREVLTFVRNQALRQVERIDEYIITVPSETVEDDCRWKLMCQAAEQAGMGRPTLIKEPEAAGYYILSNLSAVAEEEEFDNKLCMIYDFGGGTFDASLLMMDEGEIRVLGNTDSVCAGKDLGGIYIDDKVRGHLIQKIDYLKEIDKMASIIDFGSKEEEDIKKIQLIRSNRKILRETPVRAKHQLTTEPEYEEKEPGLYTYTILREEFNNEIEEIVDDTLHCCKMLLMSGGYEWKDLDYIFLVGGSSLIPLVQQKLEKKRESEEASFTVYLEEMGDKKIDYLHAVALGASQYKALQKSGRELLKSGTKNLADDRYIESEIYFHKSDYALSYYFLGILEYEGLGRKTSYGKAFKHFSHPHAHATEIYFMIGLMYFYGRGVRKNDQMARQTLQNVIDGVKEKDRPGSIALWKEMFPEAMSFFTSQREKSLFSSLFSHIVKPFELKHNILDLIIAKSGLVIKVIDNEATQQEIDAVYATDFHKLIKY